MREKSSIGSQIEGYGIDGRSVPTAATRQFFCRGHPG